MLKQKVKCAQCYHQRKKERKKENKVLIFAKAPFFPSLIHVSSVILFLYMTMWFTLKQIFLHLSLLNNLCSSLSRIQDQIFSRWTMFRKQKFLQMIRQAMNLWLLYTSVIYNIWITNSLIWFVVSDNVWQFHI